MLRRWQHIGGVVLAVAGSVLAASFGGQPGVVVAYSLSAALGVVLYWQGDTYATVGPVSGNVLVGYLGGVVLSLGVAMGLLVWFFNVPVDFAAWQSGLLLWEAWAGIGVAALSGFFLTGMVAALN